MLNYKSDKVCSVINNRTNFENSNLEYRLIAIKNVNNLIKELERTKKSK